MDRKTEEGKRRLWNMLNRSIQAEYISLPLCQPADSDYEMGKHCSCLCHFHQRCDNDKEKREDKIVLCGQ